MPGDDESRPPPGDEPAHIEALQPTEPPTSSDSTANRAVDVEPESIAEQLRRRRQASLRLPPLATGKRDPWDLYPRDGAA
jgi:hypothetical protein